jgi:CubicO group peptidase (beta-lactamase class C family)
MNNGLRWILIAANLCFWSATSAVGQGLPTAKPEKVGLSSERLERLEQVMQAYVDQEKVAGMITMIARRGRVAHFERYGLRDLEEKEPMELDTIFRIYSMTKPVTSVALMMLYEEGKFELTDPVSKFIPEFGALEVYAGGPKEEMVLVELERPVNIKDLLVHTAGLTYGIFSSSPVDDLYVEADVLSEDGTLKDMVRKLGEIPLRFQPGSEWHYGVATDVLGYLIEVISGQPLDRFLAERIFEPLKMKDTAFHVAKRKRGRFAAMHKVDEDGVLSRDDTEWTKAFDEPPTFLSGGGGLVSTASDYMRFCAMMLGGGTLDGVRLLSRKTVELMTTNHLPDELVPIRFESGAVDGYGFGLGFSVRLNLADPSSLGSVGMYRWGGYANTLFWIDPQEDLIAIALLQYLPYGHYPIQEKFQTLTYQAIAD